MVEISVIIPAYNAVDYMDETFNSIINQSFRDLEIICVDDGSTDDTLDRLNSYADKDSRIKVYSQDNQGPGGATNTGLSKATGKYIYLMDCDDIIELDALEKLYLIMEKENLDMVIFPAVDYDEDTGKYEKTPYFAMFELNDAVGGTIFDWRDIGELIFKISVTPWSKLYRHDIIKKSGAQFPLNLIYHDNPFFWEVLFSSSRIYFLNEFLYTRRVHSASCTNSFDKRTVDTIKINNLVVKTFIDYGHFEKYKYYLYNNKVSIVTWRYTVIQDEFKELLFTEMKKDFIKIIPHENYDDFYSHLYHNNKILFDNVIESDNHYEYDLRNEISKLEIDKNELVNHIKSIKKKNNKLTKENKQLKKLNNSILSSKSWKLTKPLRSFKRLF